MKTDIWQTTNQQPWVEALASGLVSVKTRTSKPVVPVGATVLLHASKQCMWRYWKQLSWTNQLDITKIPRGMIVAVATVEAVGFTEDIFRHKEYKYWEVEADDSVDDYNSAAKYAIRFNNIVRIKPVAAKGFQAPFAHANLETIKAVIASNPKMKARLKI